MSRLLFILCLAFNSACASSNWLKPCGNGASAWARESLIREVSSEDVANEIIVSIDVATLPEGEAKVALEEWARVEASKLLAELREGDEVWFVREPKGAESTWFREGYIVTRKGCVAAELVTKDDM